MNAFRRSSIILAVAAMLPLAVMSGHAAAEDQPKQTQIVLSSKPALDDKGHAVKGQYKIIATLTTADGRFVAKGSVSFVEKIEFFGLRSSGLGSAVTNGTGNASVIYQPSQEGEHTIIAHYGGDKQYAGTDAQFALEATDVVPPFIADALPLVSVGKWLSVSLAVLGVAFWLVLLGVVGRTMRLIRAAPDAVLARTPEMGSHGEEVSI